MLIETSKIKLECLQTVKGNGPFKKIKGDLERLLKAFEDEFQFKGVIELSLTLCGKMRIRSLNKDYRKKDKITDVLSFPVHENFSKVKFSEYVELGDIFICQDVAIRQAKEFKITLREEILHLLTHGFLHLLGYDHEISQREEKKMFGLEKKLISKIGKKNG